MLILIVGSNPLPNYLSACALHPRRIALVHTKETTEAKDRLKRELAGALGESVTIDDHLVEDATSATAVRRVIETILQDSDASSVSLNYTGGTKVMAAHARMAFLKAGGKEKHASYLDEGGAEHQPRLRCDNGDDKPLSVYSNVSLTLKTVLGLHGITHMPRTPKIPAPTIEDAREILCKVLGDVSLAAALYCERERLEEFSNPSKAILEPFRADRYGLSLSLPEFPAQAQLEELANTKEKKSWFKQWYSFVGGEWLEEWVGAQISRLASQLSIDPDKDVTVGLDAKRGDKPAQLEVDIAVIRGCRSYFISCTTDTTKHICKSKLFEIAVRSRQLGGDLARAALICLADRNVIDELRKEVDDRPDPRVAIRVPSVADVHVFGKADIDAWSDCNGKQPNLHSLKTWLES